MFFSIVLFAFGFGSVFVMVCLWAFQTFVLNDDDRQDHPYALCVSGACVLAVVGAILFFLAGRPLPAFCWDAGKGVLAVVVAFLVCFVYNQLSWKIRTRPQRFSQPNNNPAGPA